MTTAAIRKKLTAYLQVADEEKVKAIYTMVADDMHTAENDWDESFIKELKRRSKGIADQTAKTYTREETKKAATAKVKARK